MKKLTLIAASAIAFACTTAEAADIVSGECRHEDEVLKVVDGIVLRVADDFEPEKKKLVLFFSDMKLDRAKIGEAPNAKDEARNQVWSGRDVGLVELEANDENQIDGFFFNRGGTSASQSGTGVGQLTLKTNDDQRVAGNYSLDDPEVTLKCELSFDLSHASLAEAVASAPPKPVGKALPAGGGEPGKVFLANHAAMRKGDIDAMVATATTDTAAEMRAARGEKDFPMMLEMMKAFAPVTVTVVSGEDFGDTATLKIEGADEAGEKMYGTTRMAKEAGAWKVVKTEMSNKPN